MTEFDQACLRYHGRILAGKHKHWCREWDGLPVDETCAEYECCTCWPQKVDPLNHIDIPSDHAHDSPTN